MSSDIPPTENPARIRLKRMNTATLTTRRVFITGGNRENPPNNPGLL